MKRLLRFVLFVITLVVGLFGFDAAMAETQKAVFPFYGKVTVTQGYGTGMYSHIPAGCRAIDVVFSGRAHAPFDMMLVFKSSSEYGNSVIYQSKEKVLMADGTTDYVLVLMCHDDDISDAKPEYRVGDEFYDMGSAGLQSTGDHVHLECAIGEWKGVEGEGLLNAWESWNRNMAPQVTMQHYSGENVLQTAYFYTAKDPDQVFHLTSDTTISYSVSDSYDQAFRDTHQNHWKKVDDMEYETEWTNVSSNDKSNSLNTVQDNTDTNAFLYGEVRYSKGSLLDGAGCFLSTSKTAVQNAMPSDVGNALHVTDPASSFATAGNGYQDESDYRYTKIYYTAKAGGLYGFNTTLMPGTKYYYRFYALRTVEGVQEITYSEINEFTTTGASPVMKYNLTISGNEGGTVDAQVSGSYEKGDTVTLTATPSAGYKFAGWTSSNGGTFANAASASTTFTMPANDTTVTASFQKQYRLTTSAEVGGTVAALNGYYDSGMIISLSATPSAGYKFVSWTSSNGGSFANASNAVTTFIMPAADTVVTANFEPLSTEWSPIQPSGWPIITATQYSQRTKSTTTSASSTLNGWTLYDTTIGEWGGWSEWSTAPVTANADCEVETRTVPAVTKTVHKYSHYRAYLADLGWRTAPLAYSGWNGTWYYITLDSPLSYLGTFDGYAGYGYYNNYVWFNYTTEQQTVTEAYTQYRYRTRSRTYHFYQWSDWSEWTLDVLNAEANKEVQTRRVYKLWSGIHIAKLPSQLETIREQAYSGVKALAHLQIPSGVKTIGSKAFAECAELKSVYLPASVSDIAKDAFYGCHELTLYVEAGTEAEKYASSLGIPYYCVK